MSLSLSGQVSRGERTAPRGSDPESHITGYTLGYEDKNIWRALTRKGVVEGEAAEGGREPEPNIMCRCRANINRVTDFKWGSHS